MKFLLSLAVGLALVTDCLATGTIPQNSPESGVINLTVTNGLTFTNSFPIPYTTQPVVTLASVNGTNNTPFTVTAVTFTNFLLTVTGGATTNASVAWQSFAGYPRVYAGTNILASGGLATNVFPVPYVYPPVLNIADTITNGYAAGVTTTTNVVITCGPGETIYWGTLGISYSPGQNTVTY